LAHALSVAEGVGDRVAEGQARYMLADIAIARADYATAGKHIDRTKRLFEELGMRLWLAKTLILRSEVHDNAGETELAESDLRQARDLLAAISSKQSDRLLRQFGDVGPSWIPDAVTEPSRG
jgi:ATP/maltotriose-dependent transcriptional regulator MalT